MQVNDALAQLALSTLQVEGLPAQAVVQAQPFWLTDATVASGRVRRRTERRDRGSMVGKMREMAKRLIKNESV